MWERIITFAGKFIILLGVVKLTLFFVLTFLFNMFDASDHLSGLGPRDWLIVGLIVSIMIIVSQKLGAWVFQ